MSQDTELQRLELIVEKLLAKYEDLRAENAQLKQELAEKKLRLTDLENNLTAQKTERGEIGKRVSRLVEQIEEWELALEDEESSQSAVGVEDTIESVAEVEDDEEPEPAQQETGVEGEVSASVQVSEEADTTEKAEEEGRLQHNLFSVSGFQR